jgi:hypothetical protein
MSRQVEVLIGPAWARDIGEQGTGVVEGRQPMCITKCGGGDSSEMRWETAVV